jgi:transcriptional regulator with XRE-family HTH domain
MYRVVSTVRGGANVQQALYREFGQRVSEARKGAGITQRELAARLGRSRTFVTNLETGVNPVNLHVLFEVAHILGAQPESLLPHTPMVLSDAVLPAKYRRMVQDVRKGGEE